MLMDHTLAIRRYRDTDHDAVWALQHLAERDYARDHIPPVVENDPNVGDFHHIEDVYLRHGGEFLVGFYKGQLVAMGGIARIDRERAYVKRVRVHHAYHGHGFGRAIMQALEERARALGYAVLETDTSIDRLPARQLYLRCGFRDVGRAILGGQWECVLFKKEISDRAMQEAERLSI
jgi:GNAT superfamily N-acetyltransferase